METDVVEIVEDACMAVEGIVDISSTSQQGQATVTLEFEVGRDIDAALQETQTKIAQAQRRLPEALDPPVITKSNPEDQPILWVGVSGTRSPSELADIARFQVRERIQTVHGVGEIFFGGYRERSLRVWLDAARMDARGVTATDVVDGAPPPARRAPGRAARGRRARAQRAPARRGARRARRSRGSSVAERDGAVIRLGDVATIEDGLEDRRVIARNNGAPAIGLGVRKQRGANAVVIAHGVRERLAEIRATLPEGVDARVTFDTTAPVEEAIHEIVLTLILAVILTALVCWLFLGSLSSTFNVLLSIPTSLVGHVRGDALPRVHAEHVHPARASRSPSASSWTTRSWCSRTSSAGRSTARAACGPPSRARARSRSRRWPRRRPSWPSSCPSRS